MSTFQDQLKSYFEPIGQRLLGKQGFSRVPKQDPVQPRPIAQMMRDLKQVDELSWGRYAFSRDPLNRRIPVERREELIRRANECGREYAKRMAQEYGTQDPKELAAKMGMNVAHPDMPKDPGRVLFAEFKEPNRIFVYMDAVHKAGETMDRPGMRKAMQDLDIERLLLAHELFHFVEEKYKKEIFTRTEKIDLPSIPMVKNRSTLMSLGELAAMEFARVLNHLPYSPYLMDVMLTYGYSQDSAIRLYEEIMRIADLPIPDPEEEAYSAPRSVYDM